MLSANRLRLILSALLAAAVVAIYAPVSQYDFIALDDADYVKNNEFINHGFSRAGVNWAFENIVSGNWHPVTMLSHMADCQVYGLSPGGPHTTNVLLHLANTLLLFWLLLALTERRKIEPAIQPATLVGLTVSRSLGLTFPQDPNLWPCALVAALFAVHPLHVESVAWISERKDVLSGFFALLTLLCYSKYVEKSGAQKLGALTFYILALLLFALGLMSKSMLVTLPFVMLLLDFWPLQRFKTSGSVSRRNRAKVDLLLVIEKIPFLILAAIFSIITFLVQKKAGAVVALKYFPMHARLANAMVAYMHYLEKTFWPSPLAMLYPYEHWSTGQVASATALFIGLSLVALLAAPRKPYIFVGWFWFVGMLVPVIGLVQVGLQGMADHYTYLPLIGIFIALAWGLAELTNRALQISQFGTGNPQLGRGTVFTSIALPVILALSLTTAVQVGFWQNSESLFKHAALVTGHNTVAHYILGALYDSQGKTDRAAAEFAASVKDDPGNVKALCGLGYIFYNQGKLDEAEQQYEAALRVAPDMAKAHFGLGDVLMKQHQFDQAMSEYSLALQSDPDIPDAHYQMAALFSAEGDAASAISQLEEAVRLAPDWPLALNNLAWMRATEQNSKLRDGAEAVRLASRIVALIGKNNPSTLDTLAAAYAETGQFADATATAKKAIEIAKAANETNLVKEIQSRLKLYQSKQPYRE